MGRRANRQGTISEYRTGSGELRWRIAYWNDQASGERLRKFRKGFLTEAEANDALEAIRVDQRRGEHVEPVRTTLNDYAETYFDSLRVAASTLAGYRKHYRVHIRPSSVGRLALGDITKDALNAFYRALERSGRKDKAHAGEPLSPATVRHIHILISQILAHAVEHGGLAFNAAKRANPPTKAQAAPPEMTTWSAEEAAQFLTWSAERGHYLWLAWRLLLATGLRRGELLALRWRDIDFQNHVITVARSMSYVKEAGIKPVVTFKRPKNGKVRNVDIDETVSEALKERRRRIEQVAPEFVRADSLIFTNRYGKPHNAVQFSAQWRRTNARAVESMPDLPTLHVHELRHTHATLLLRAGVHPKIVSERLGHADVQTTMNTYSHAVRSLQRGAADLIGGMLG